MKKEDNNLAVILETNKKKAIGDTLYKVATDFQKATSEAEVHPGKLWSAWSFNLLSEFFIAI